MLFGWFCGRNVVARQVRDGGTDCHCSLQPQWPVLFESEKRRLLALFDGVNVAVEHIGSTAVDGLRSKPIIDIMLGVERLSEVEQRLASIEQLGYHYIAELESEIPERRFFIKRGAGKPRTHHLHAVDLSSDFRRDHLLFRDVLRSHPETASKYCQLKVSLAQHCRDDRKAYVSAKSAFIGEVLARKRRHEGPR